MVASLFVLLKSSQFMNRSAQRIGLALGVSPFIIGVLLLAVGTSLPELITSIIAATKGTTEIIVGNVVGSNISNIFLILGITTLVSGKPIKIGSSVITTDLYFLVSSALFFTLSVANKSFGWFEGALSLAGFAVYLYYIIKEDHSALEDEVPEPRETSQVKTFDIIIFVASSAGLYFGAEFSIRSVIEIAEIIDVGTELIATTAIALGTSLPELVVSVEAVRKGNSEMAIGNILGSSIFNTFLVMGVAGLIRNIVIPDSILYEILPFMLIATFLAFFLSRDKRFTKWEGFIFLIFYVMFVREVLNDLLKN